MMLYLALAALAVLIPPVLFDLAARPTIRRLGLRNVMRRPGEASLVIGGSMLATALITASLLVGDSFGTSIRSLGQTFWGPVDEVFDDADPAATADAIRAANDGSIDGVLPARFAPVSVGTVGDNPTVLPELRVLEFDFADAKQFGGDPEATGLAGVDSLAAGSVVLNETTAEDLGVSVGDQLEIFGPASLVNVTVGAIVERTGLAGVGEIIANTGDISTGLGATGSEGSVVLVSNTGDVYAGAERTDEAIAVIAGVVGEDVDVNDVKRNILEDADEEAAETTELFGTIGGFSVVAGILLVINLFVMIASERKTELGTLRAVGLGRSAVRRAFSLEGAIYGVVAAALGALLGIGVASGVMRFASSLSDGGVVTLALSVKGVSLLTGAVIGLAISQITVTFTSARVTRLNIVRALKDIAEPPSDSHPIRRIALSVIGMAIGAALFVLANGTPVVAMLAPVIVAVAAIPLLSIAIGGRPAVVVGCAVALAWAAAVFGVMSETMADPDISLFLLQGVLLVGLAVAIVASLDGVWVGLARRLTGGSLAPRLGLAHPLARPVRSALLVAMYGLVIFTVSFMAVINTVFAQQAPDFAAEAGGAFDLVVDSNRTNPIALDDLNSRPDVEVAYGIERGELSYEFERTEDGVTETVERERWSSVIPSDLRPELGMVTVARFESFADDQAFWSAMAAGDPWVALPEWVSHELGDELTVIGPDGDRQIVRVGATTDMNWATNAGLYLNSSLAPVLSSSDEMITRYLVLANGDGEEVATAINDDLSRQGADARTFLSVASEEVAEQETFINLLQGYLALGLLIGILGLAVVLVRAVRERRLQLGMMRAVGVMPSVIRNTFIVEAAFIGIQGVVLGIGLGLLSSWQVLTRSTAFEDNLRFAVPFTWLAGLGAVALLASLAAGAWPALRAAKTSPAVALRMSG